MLLNHAIKKSSSIDIGLVYLFKAYPRSLSTGLFNSLRIYEHTLVWSRYFELLFDDTCIRIVGASCVIPSVHLATNGLHVNLSRGDLLLPTTIGNFADFNTTVMSVLMLLKKEVVSIADKLLLVLKEKTVVKGPLSRSKANSTNYMFYYQRDTWYTPPRRSQSQIPSNLFGFPPPPSILQKVMPLSYKTTKTSEGASNSFVDDSEGGYDEFGFKKVENEYYSNVTDSVWGYHPHQEEYEE
ncbi:hypothetical protein INT48_007664 [Thamnidium elegans]|uniref:Uncharacterized protein n=1 Tax=Thamnidium elegans TaxID=101142 RepID=A0A8H7SH85_9FUNG|nr:hypothetical protein INT48_007664 [Thamnidium elegans]